HFAAAVFAFNLLSAISAAAENVTLDVAYVNSSEMRRMHEQIAQRFMADHSGVTIKLQAIATTYDDMVQRALRAAITGGMPDIAFHAYNRVRVLVDRRLPVALDPFIASEKSWGEMGYLPTVLDLARVGSTIYGLPFNTSTPIIYYNA